MSEPGPQRRFSFHECLGRGGFGEVYRATMTNPSGLSQVVAVKVLHAKFEPGSAAVSRLRDEGRLMAALNHPNILRVIDLLTLDGRSALIAEYMEGADVNTLVKSKDLPARVGLEIIAAAARGLEGAWSGRSPDTGEPLRLVHRDIKPANIRVGPHGDVKVLDFGIARTDSLKREAETEAHMVLGSLPYLSPEACVAEDLTVKTDVYALGCTLFEVLSGKRMTTGKTPMAVYSMLSVEAHHDAHRAKRAALLPEDELLRDIVARATAFSADDRPDPSALADLCEDAAARLTDQPTLKRWARAYDWPEPPTNRGDLSGATLNDSMTFPTSSSSAHVTTEHAGVDLPSDSGDAATGGSITRVGARRLGLGLGVSLLLAGLSLVVCAGGVVLSGALSTTGAPVAQVAEPKTVAVPPLPVTTPAAPLTVGPRANEGTAPSSDAGSAERTKPPEPMPAPTQPVPKPVVAPKKEARPAPRTPPPTAKPSPPVAPKQAQAPLAESPELKKVVFMKEGEEFQPGNVPPGTYELMTDFGAGMKSDGTVEVKPGEQVDIACSTRKQMCWVR